MTPHIIGVILAIISAAAWGTGDFSGGVATRSQSQFQVLFLSAVPGIVLLAVIAIFIGENLPSQKDVLWALSAGISGALGVAALYKGLSIGNAATVAPTAAVIGAGLPVAFSCLTLGIPGTTQLIGFLAAVFGIWFVSRPSEDQGRSGIQGLIPAVLAGAGFGGFFILIAQVSQGMVFIPLVLTKTAAFTLAFFILIFRQEGVPSLTSNPIALTAGVFDAGGNIFFLLAKQYTRLDVAAVLASMYPSVTVILACLIQGERVSIYQWQGVVLCVIAVALIGT